ncbi:FcoT family thioesterase [Nocardia sp. NPDC051030]|uniref:FcoT family thioesterase n=1 Tax=Nocardia sp. NPDC051030 TaxID=3155162 RepID=UPI00344792B5
MNRAPAPVATREDAELLARAMAPYAPKGTVYLREASVTVREGQVVGTGRFAITESCYIEETGHFNAVEFNISYNQLFYYTLAVAVRDKLIPELAHWSMDDYWRRQLPAVVITDLRSHYRRPIDARDYRAELTICEVEFRHRSRPLIALSTQVEFTDSGSGSAMGGVEIALLDPPQVSPVRVSPVQVAGR